MNRQRNLGTQQKQYFDQNISDCDEIASLEQLTSEALEVMPEKWCREIHTVALSCNQNTVLQFLEKIPQKYNTLKNKLENLAHNYQFDIISNLSDRPWHNQ